jgi:ABC-type arginine/histidine transport system permease subunit
MILEIIMVMRKTVFILVITLLHLAGKAQTPYYYYYEGEKRYLSLNTEYAFLSLKDQQLPIDIQQYNIETVLSHSDK